MRILLLLSFLLTSQLIFAQSSSIIISPIGPQTAYENTRITVYFSTLKHFDNIDFTIANLPDFATLSYDQSGSGYITFDPSEGQEGKYTISIEAQSGQLSNITSFDLSVLPIDDSASIYYIDPETGTDDATGTEQDPFATLSSFLANQITLINDNTHIFLKSGFHGSPVFTGTRSNPVKVLAAAGHTPRVKKLDFSFTTGWYVSGLDISPQNENKSDIETLINVFAGSKNIEITNCKIYAIEDASSWTTNEMWYEGSGNGILSSGTECLFRNNLLKNTWFSVEMRKKYNEFSYNIIDWFGGDAVRAIASNQTVNYNQIKNATVFDYDHPTRPQHDDAIQSWTFNNPIKDITIVGNQIADIANPNMPLPSEIMQAIADFDGFAEDWVITNNLVITHHAHGIALYGAKNCNVSNNTVTRNPFNLYSQQFKPWIRISPRKEQVGGEPCFGNLVRNNIMSSYQEEDLEPATADHNLISTIYEDIFEDYGNWDFHLSENSAAIDAGRVSSTMVIDQEQKLRNVGLPDIGCFEKGANLTDREAPSIPANFQIISGQTDITLDWEESTDNTEVSHYEITVNENIHYKAMSNSFQVTSLEPGQEYSFEVVAIDYFGNRSAANELTAETNTAELMTVHFIRAHKHDQLIKSNLKLMWVGMPTIQIGDYENGADAIAVIPFQLPCIDDDRTVASADVLLNFESTAGSPEGDLDMYLLELRSKSDVLASDHYQGPSDQASSGIIIAENALDGQVSGQININQDQQIALGTELNTRYDAGACNKFAFVRLNSNTLDEPTNGYYSLSSSDNLNSNQRPLLKIISNSPNGVTSTEIKNGLKITPNLIHDEDILILLNGEFTSKEIRLEIHDSQGRKVIGKIITNSESEITISKELPAGIYYATLLGTEKYAQAKFVKL